MTLKIQKQANEFDLGNGNYTLKNQIGTFISYKITGISKGFLIPDDLIAEAEDFMIRNVKKEADYHCCQRCLKAHILKKASDMGLSKESKKFLESKFSDETGHYGYYMDGEELIALE